MVVWYQHNKKHKLSLLFLLSLVHLFISHLFANVDVTELVVKEDVENIAKPFIPWKQRMSHPVPCIVDRHRSSDWDPMDGYTQNQPTDAGLLCIKMKSMRQLRLPALRLELQLLLPKNKR